MNTDAHRSFSKIDRSICRGRIWLSFLSVLICVHLWTIPASTQTVAPGGPGADAQWATAGKQAVGTANSPNSKVWFTLAQGVMTEVYYPDVMTANVHMLQFIVVDPKTKKVETEFDDATHDIKVLLPDSLAFQQINTAKSGNWVIAKTYATDPSTNTVAVQVSLVSDNPLLELFVYFDPAVNNSGMNDAGWTKDGLLMSSDGDKFLALASKAGFAQATNGFLGSSDGLSQLKQQKKLIKFDRADNGNVVQVAQVKPIGTIPKGVIFLDGKRTRRWTNVFNICMGFGASEVEAITAASSNSKRNFAEIDARYREGWENYVKTLPKVDPKYQAQFNMAAMQLKAHEDKSNPGANVASLSIPWGGGVNANDNNVGGYHLVWSRDLYQVATAFMALGDTAAANRALDFIFTKQQKPDGSFPQNSKLDGTQFWGSLQMDEVAFPLILAYQLDRNDKEIYEKHIKKSADFIVRNGPATPQERWEEEGGYSPSTIAAEIAGLVCAAEIAKKNGDTASATIWLAAADDWARNVDRWTATTTGKYGDGNYYLRITANGNPDSGDKLELNNGAGTFDERDIVDAGFLELVRLGIKPADDPLIVKSLKVIDQQIKVDTPNGPAFYRYNHDGYGEMEDGRRWNWDGKYTGKGRLWALLSGERGEYEIALISHEREKTADLLKLLRVDTPGVRVITDPNVTAGSFKPVKKSIANKQSKPSAPTIDPSRRLDHILAFANDGLMIPEQIWDEKEVPKNIDKQFIPELKFGEGTGSATPLAWSMAQFIRLATNLKAGRNLETPQVVYDRYKNGIPGQVSSFGGNDSEVILPVKPGETMAYPRSAPIGAKAAYRIGDKSYLGETDAKGQLVMKFEVPADGTVAYGGIVAPDGSTSFERVTLRQNPLVQEFTPALIEKIKTATSNPIVDTDGRAILFYRGIAKTVTVAGDINGWNPNREFLQQIAPDLWAIKLALGTAGRTEYKIVVDGKWILDPANQKDLDNGVGDRNNVLEMPAYKPTEWLVGKDDGKIMLGSGLIPPQFQKFTVQSKDFGEREISVYLPKDYWRGNVKRYRVLYLQDGSDYLRRASAKIQQENLVEAGKVEPFIMVFIDPKDRNKEYWADNRWADFVANEVVPEVDRRYKTVQDREGRAVIGASLGGVTSLWIGLKHPDKFGALGGQSSSFWIDNGRVVKKLSELDASKTKFRFYLDDGLLEGTDDTRRVNVMLRGKGYSVTYVEQETGHNWTAWRDRLADAFIVLTK